MVRVILAVTLCVVLAGCASSSNCRVNSDCPQGSYCSKPVGKCDGPGECQVKPEACTFQYDPVCGCDGQTYGNACAAAMDGVNVKHVGECP